MASSPHVGSSSTHYFAALRISFLKPAGGRHHRERAGGEQSAAKSSTELKAPSGLFLTLQGGGVLLQFSHGAEQLGFTVFLGGKQPATLNFGDSNGVVLPF
jgi:hypothetical protein